MRGPYIGCRYADMLLREGRSLRSVQAALRVRGFSWTLHRLQQEVRELRRHAAFKRLSRAIAEDIVRDAEATARPWNAN